MSRTVNAPTANPRTDNPRIFNLGSINMDQIIRLGHFPAPGETISGDVSAVALGGKGLNVSVALTRAGQAPIHIGAIGAGAADVIAALDEFSIDRSHIAQTNAPSGTAFVFVDDAGENSIVVCPGANHAVPMDHIETALDQAQAGDWLVLQNETNAQAEVAHLARARGMKVAYMAAPFEAAKIAEVIDLIDLLALNETEARQLETHMGQGLETLGVGGVLVTLGAKGAKFIAGEKTDQVAAIRVPVVDTTAAGDTFFGFFLAEFLATGDVQASLSLANAAAAITVQTMGAAPSIPARAAVEALRDSAP